MCNTSLRSSLDWYIENSTRRSYFWYLYQGRSCWLELKQERISTRRFRTYIGCCIIIRRKIIEELRRIWIWRRVWIRLRIEEKKGERDKKKEREKERVIEAIASVEYKYIKWNMKKIFFYFPRKSSSVHCPTEERKHCMNINVISIFYSLSSIGFRCCLLISNITTNT